MNKAKVGSMQSQSLYRLAVNALGLIILIPTLGVLFLFRDQLEGKWLPLIFILAISVLGYSVLWRVLGAIINVLRGLESITRGEATAIPVENAPDQLREMTEIINALNQLTLEFRENAKQLETFIEQFATLAELTEISARIPDINELLSLVLRKAMGSTNASIGTIMLVREDGEGLDIVAAEGWTPSIIGPIDPSETLAGRVISGGEPIRVENLDEVPELERRHDSSRYSSPSFLIMPLKAKTATIGAVCLSEKGNNATFGESDTKFLTVLLGQVGFAVENARLLKQARDAAEQLTETVHHQEIKLQDAHKQILQAEKLSALGQLIAGVAHEINNPLTTVVGYTELVLGMENESRVEDKLKTVLSEANRATRIVQNLLSFARERKPEKRAVNLNEVVENIASLRQYDLRTRDIELLTELDANLPATMADTDQIQQVLLNMVNNSAQAMTKDGKREIKIGTRWSEEWIELIVADTGKGIPESIASRVFDPFFSTKGEKTNTGLGLSISYGIVKEHGGDIQVSSVVGGGTTMTIRLPILQAVESSSHGSQPEKKEFPTVKNNRALVVDDEEPIAHLLSEILTPVGFDVRVAEGGPQALELLHNEEFDLVICDLRMPEVDGQQLYREARKSRPEIKDRFLLTSGDVADPQTKLFAENHNIPLIPKPFSKQQVLEAAFEAMERRDGQTSARAAL